MIIVDTQVHASPYWYEPVETLLYHMETNNVDKALLISYRGNFNKDSYELDCVRKYPGRFGAVVIVDSKAADALDVLERWANEGAIGVRTTSCEHLPGSDPLALWRKASELGLTVSCHGSIDVFASSDFQKIVETFPDLKIVLEHLGGFALKDTPQLNYQTYERVLALSQFPNVYVKLQGFGEILPRPFPMRISPFDEPPDAVKMVYDAFGSRRIMWGSNFPPCSACEGYANTLRFPMEKIPFFSEEDKEWIFGKTALSVWKIADC